MMSALAILYLILPFPIAFVIHDAEEILIQSRWIRKHRETITRKFPRRKSLINHLVQLGSKAFGIAALEELLLILVVTGYVLMQGRFALELWSALFMAFSFHLLGHIGLSIMITRYTPGLITSVLLLPYACYGLWSIWLVMNAGEMIVLGLAGLLLMILNLIFAHWLGLKVCKNQHLQKNS